MFVTIDVQEGLKVTEETFERLASAGDTARFELVAGRWESVISTCSGLNALSEVGAKVADGTIRVPDVAVLIDSDRLGWGEMTLPASAYHTLVEVVSGESETRDKVTKAAEYAKAGLANYWIVGEHPFRPDDGIVARHVNERGVFRLQDTVLLAELLAGSAA